MRITPAWRYLSAIPVLVLLAGCNPSSDLVPKPSGSHINNKTKFSSRAYGVAASPRVTTSRKVRKGGGRAQIGRPYKVKGRWYTPKEEPGYDRVGQASWYGPNFHGRLTANGEIYDQYALSGAHPTFPLPSYARVTNVANGRSVIVRVNDRGPYHAGRVIDLSAKASELLDYQRRGVAQVRVQYIGKAPLHGKDARYLSASYKTGAQGDFASALVAKERLRANATAAKRFDPVLTGSVSGTDSSKAKSDPFLLELRAVQGKVDTGSTLAKRFRDG